ncbi:hypothetical protein [Rhodospirillaceae bacterium SYSU D60014]|uniref:hypothetical protein n=1 Tax=Virgifigura deserti TaxID=2268457 RepID=UPI0013C46042
MQIIDRNRGYPLLPVVNSAVATSSVSARALPAEGHDPDPLDRITLRIERFITVEDG